LFSRLVDGKLVLILFEVIPRRYLLMSSCLMLLKAMGKKLFSLPE
jgi:hypothetical protein